MIRIMARITARAGSEGDLQQVLQELPGPSCREEGCLGYELFLNEDDPREFVTVERWRDQAAADAHLNSAHVAAVIARASGLLAQAPLIYRFRQIG
ncbi:MAG: antibiotic biosynthesis monooxygenase [Candidatus Accumulibacter sp.]|jgi:quinol monooxygenase YgiN|nr:antibiotic biosynthesis monooxygenase [Candidatus Accumulibacter necessarius]